MPLTKCIACIAALFFCSPLLAQDKVNVSTYSFSHDYKTGEKISYAFEDVDYEYSAVLNEGFYTVNDFQNAQEIQVRVDETVVEENGTERKQFTISDAKYRKITNGKDGLSAGELTPVAKLIPGFPETITYTCALNEGDFLAAILKAYQPYMSNPLGVFLYYKMMDVHTFGPTVANLNPQSLETMKIAPSKDMELANGKFHNHSPITLFQRIDTINGSPQAYFKIMTMGNYYQTIGNGRIDTNYQYTFHVSMDGPYKGLLFDGELQEHVFAHNAKAIISRQLSIRRLD
jgi:hypothetical protein